MLVRVPDHFSTKLKFNLGKLPAIVTDRSSLGWSVAGWFAGLLMLWLGIFELFSFIRAEKSEGQSYLTVEIFALIVILCALSLVFYSIFSFIRYKKFYFDGTNFEMIYRPALGIKHHFQEPLVNYAGVRLRVLFVQSGLFNKNRYIIDLYHQDNNKIIPLFISTKNSNIRKIWEDYARAFNLPALSVGDRGVVQRECDDLDKSIKELYDAGKLPFIASGKFPAPDSLDITEQKASTTVKPKEIYWDTFSTLSLFSSIAATFVLIAGGVYLTIIDSAFPVKYWAFGIALVFAIIYFASRLFCTYRMVISDKNIMIEKSLLGTKIKTESLLCEKIENIELSYNPTSGQYNLAIVSDEKVLIFGSRLPVSDLLWLKDFVIRKLIGN